MTMAMINKITPNIYYHIISKKTDKVLDIDAVAGSENGGALQLYDKIGGENQQFKFVLAGGGLYKIVCRSSKKPIDIVSVGSSNGAWLHQWEDSSVETQIWKVKFNKDGYFKIISKYSSRVLDAGLEGVNNSRVKIWDDFDSDNQLWYLERPSSNSCAGSKKTAKKTDSSEKIKAKIKDMLKRKKN